jgi:hypothetical protein
MKIKFLSFTLLVFTVQLGIAQNILEINLNKRNNRTNASLKFKDNLLTNDPALINFADIQRIVVTGNVTTATITLSNTEAPGNSITLRAGENYTVASKVVANESFTLSNKIAIRITDGQSVKLFTLQDNSSTNANNGTITNGSGAGNGTNATAPADGEYKPGSFVNDALYLAGTGNNTAVKFYILSYYANGETDPVKLVQFYAGNKFLEPVVNSVVNTPGAQAGGGLSGILSSVGNANVAKYADGLAKFIVERSKEELNIAFFRKFQEFIKAYPEVQVAFPTTYKFLQEIYSYQYAAMLPALRAGFQKDLNAFAKNLIKLRDLTNANCPLNNQNCKDRMDAISAFLTTNPAGRGIIAGLIVADNILEGNNAADILDNLANDPVFQHKEENVSNVIQFTNLVSQSMVSQEEGRIWVTKAEISKLLKNEAAIKIYLGLLYNADKKKGDDHIRFTIGSPVKTVTLQAFINNLHDKWATLNIRFRSDFTAIANTAASVSSLTENIIDSEEKSQESSILTYANYASALSTFFKVTIVFIGDADLYPGFEKLKADMLHFTRIIDPATDACYDIKSQNYTALVMHTSEILKEILQEKYTFKEDYLRYGTFMASVVEAKNSDEVKDAIEAIVLPVGSASIKRETDFNISLNAYIGPFAGTEYLPALKENKSSFVTGVTAPIGIAFSWGNLGRKGQLRKNNKEIGGKSFSLFIPLIDIGAMAAFRMGDDSSNIASDVKLKNILSPGLYAYFGFGKCPISIGIGGQLGPQLRGIHATDINIDKNYYFRFGATLVVDIPMFNLYTKSRSKSD